MTPEWPGGLAHLVVEAQFKKYQPQDIITRVELRQMLNGIKMKEGEDLAMLFEQISSIENKYNKNGKIDEEDLIAVVLDAAPSDYQSILMIEQRLHPTDLKLEHLGTCMNQYWQQTALVCKSDENEKDKTEVALLAFNGKCYNCGKIGHKSPDAKNQESRNRLDHIMKLKLSSQAGVSTVESQDIAMGKDCWQKEENKKDKRPRGYKGKEAEPGAPAAVDGGHSHCEFLLCSMTFPQKQELLSDPNVWIGDTGAKQHIMAFKKGMMNIRKVGKEDKVTMEMDMLR
jgi:gag-polypeptide of LTR copia-type/Zinc knuckle